MPVPGRFAYNKDLDRVISVETVANGLSCNCICRECGEKLEAVQSPTRKKAWHFRHHVLSDCNGGPETLLHLRAKQVFCDNSTFLLKTGPVNYTGPAAEKRMGPVTPDITLYEAGNIIVIEIFVSHPVELPKKTYYTDNLIRSLEIDLSAVPHDISTDKLETILLRETYNKTFIYWPPAPERKNSFSMAWILKGLLVVGGFLALVLLFRKPRRKK